jgi:hypothetical protein
MGVVLILAEEDSSRGLEMTEALVLVFFRDSLETDTLRLSSAVAIATLSSNSLRTAGSSAGSNLGNVVGASGFVGSDSTGFEED